MGDGTIHRRRKTDIIGHCVSDPFYDSYESEGFACYDIIKTVDECKKEYISIVFNKTFLRKLVHSHILFIKEIEKGMTPVANRNRTSR